MRMKPRLQTHEELEDDGQTVKYKIGKVTVDMPDKPGEGQEPHRLRRETRWEACGFFCSQPLAAWL